MASTTQSVESTPRRNTFRLGDQFFRFGTLAAACAVGLLIILIVWQLVAGSLPIIGKEGVGFISGSAYDVGANQYGAVPFIWGTFVSSLIALVVGGTIGVSISCFLVELAPKWLLKPVSFLVDLLAAIPSIIFGLWGFFVLIPWLRATFYPEVSHAVGWTGLFGTKDMPLTGSGLLTAGLVLGIMIIPTVAAITREVLLVVPKTMRDGALALGANRTEALKTVQLPFASSGILGGLIIGLGRALGETMAVTMLIGNSAGVHTDLFRPAASLSSIIATDFGEASGLQRSALIGFGLVLFIFTLLLNFLARYLVSRVKRRSGL